MTEVESRLASAAERRRETEATEWGMRDPWGATELSCVLTGRVDQCHKTAQDKAHPCARAHTHTHTHTHE